MSFFKYVVVELLKYLNLITYGICISIIGSGTVAIAMEYWKNPCMNIRLVLAAHIGVILWLLFLFGRECYIRYVLWAYDLVQRWQKEKNSENE